MQIGPPQIGIDSFVQLASGQSPAQRTAHLMEEIQLADRVGIHTFGIGEHHRPEYLASTPEIFLAAAAAVTKNIRLASAVTVLSSSDPVRIFQNFATVDLISNGRAEIVVGRGSFVESYPLFGADLDHYDDIFAEKLDLLLRLRAETSPHWEGKYRTPLTGQGVYPRPVQQPLPIRLGVGGTPNSFVRAGILGLPLTIAIIGGEPHRFRPLVDLYRQAWQRAGHAGQPDVAVHGLGFLADTTQEAADIQWPGYSQTFARIGKERGWGPITREAFDVQRGSTGAFMIGDPTTVAAKIKHYDESLGGLTRVGIHMSGGTIPHEKQMRAIELLGDVTQSLKK